MAHLRGTTHFEAPIERVFEVLSDLTLLPEYMSSISDVSEIPGAPGQVGDAYHFRSKSLGLSMAGTVVVTDVDPPTYLATLTTYDNGMRVTWTERLTPSGSETDVVDEIDYELPAGVVGSVLDRLFFRRYFERTVLGGVEPLRAIIEGKAAASRS